MLLTVLVVLGIILGAGALIVDLRRQELAAARSQIAGLSRLLAEQTTRTFDGVALNLYGARDQLAEEIWRPFALDSSAVNMLLRAKASGRPQIKSLFVVDQDGRVVNSSRPDFPRHLVVRERGFFRHFADGDADHDIFISAPEKARVDGQWTYYAAIRLGDAKGAFRGLLVAAVNIEHFESFYQWIGFDFIGRIQLLNEDGYLLAGRPHDDNAIGKQIMPAVVRLRLRDEPPGQLVETEEQTPGGPLFAAYCNVSGYPLAISVAVREDDALLTWQRLARPIVIGGGSVLLILAVALILVRNLLHRAALRAAIEESDDQLRHVMQSVQNAIVVFDAERRVITFNQGAEQLFGIPATAAVDRRIDELLAARLDIPQYQTLRRHIEESARAASPQPRIELIELLRDGEPRPVELSLWSTIVRGKMLLTAVFRSLADQRRAERELLESNRQLHKLSAALENAREEERTRISREMHDELGQLLTGIRMEISWLDRHLGGEPEALSGKIDAIKGLIDQTIAATRRISSELRPLILDHLGFAAAAAWYVDQFTNHTGLQVTLDLPEDEPPQGSPVATALFRLLQESLTNIVRHAKASQASVRLFRDDGYWRLAIEDDGQGFDPVGKWRRAGIGLLGMRERVEMLRGNLSIVSAPGQGTLIEASVPDDDPMEERDVQEQDSGFAGG
jgi:PAS domain S-box-containing protein